MLEPRDVVPDFILPVPDGGLGRFYGRAGGRLTLLAFVPADQPDGVLDELDALARAGDLALFAVLARAPAPAAHQSRREPIASYIDAAGELRDRLVGAGDDVRVLLVSPRLRVIAVFAGDDLRALGRRIDDELVAEPADRDAPVLVVPEVFEPALCDQLIRLADTEGTEATGVEVSRGGERANELQGELKRRRDHVVTDRAVFATITDRLGRRLIPEVTRAFSYRATRFEGFKIGCYDAASRGFFSRHRDNLSPATRHRRFALSLNLNDDYAGGALVFPEFGHRRYRPARGAAIVFSGSLLHEARAVTGGRRLVLISFLYRPEDGRGRPQPAPGSTKQP